MAQMVQEILVKLRTRLSLPHLRIFKNAFPFQDVPSLLLAGYLSNTKVFFSIVPHPLGHLYHQIYLRCVQTSSA